MTYHNIDSMNVGQTVTLLVSVQNAWSNKFPDRTPVIVTREGDGFLYVSKFASTRFANGDAKHGNPGHEGMNAHVSAACGAPYVFESILEQDLLLQTYAAIRRDTAKGYFAKTTASAAIQEARKQVSENRAPKYVSSVSVWAGLGGNDGKPFEAYGESAMRWFENPAKFGLRLVGLAHDVAKANHSYSHNAVDHSGWYLDDFQCEKVSGVVFQLPARNGKARYIVGYSDPYNADKYGNGPACVSLNIIEGERKDSDWETDSGLRDAARYADGIAESYAEKEREYHAAYQAGKEAREKAIEAMEACRDWKASVKAFRDIWSARHTLQAATVKGALASLKTDCAAFRQALERSREFREESKPCGDTLDAWQDGHATA